MEKIVRPAKTAAQDSKVFSHYLIHKEGMKFIRENRDRPFFAYLPWTPSHGLWGMQEDDPAWQ